MSHFTTTHNTSGQAIFSPNLPTEPSKLPIPIGTLERLSTTHHFPPDLSTEADVEQYAHDRTNASFPGSRRIGPENGTASFILSLKPGAGVHGGGMHRTTTLDVIVVLEGEVGMELDSGEKRVLKAGDSVVQRATMHRWVNVTPDEGWARMVAFVQVVAEPIKVGGEELWSEWVS
ncbi:hypothetical protein LTR85_004958 [Meristemomyces frigidus]|nr:hypothetical protein LTR85_004958 [Meristemomyces frigidus]